MQVQTPESQTHYSFPADSLLLVLPGASVHERRGEQLSASIGWCDSPLYSPAATRLEDLLLLFCFKDI